MQTLCFSDIPPCALGEYHIFGSSYQGCDVGDEIWFYAVNNIDTHSSVVPIRGQIYAITVMFNPATFACPDYSDESFFKYFQVYLLKEKVKFSDNAVGITIYDNKLSSSFHNMINWGLRNQKIIVHYKVIAFDANGDTINKDLSSRATFKTFLSLENSVQMWGDEQRLCAKLHTSLFISKKLPKLPLYNFV